MATTPRDNRHDESDAQRDTTAARPYEPPRLIEYGPLAKITQGTAGSTGESANSKMRSACL